MDILIVRGKAHQLFPEGAPEFHPDFEVVRNYTGEVQLGWDWDGATFTEEVYVDTRTYAQKRIAEYPPIEDYLDGIVKGDDAQVQAYIDACLAVKVKYPAE